MHTTYKSSSIIIVFFFSVSPFGFYCFSQFRTGQIHKNFNVLYLQIMILENEGFFFALKIIFKVYLKDRQDRQREKRKGFPSTG